MSQSPVVGGKALPLALLNLRGEIQRARLKHVSVSPYSPNNLKSMEPLIDEISDVSIETTKKRVAEP
jgi:hypothetical protein